VTWRGWLLARRWVLLISWWSVAFALSAGRGAGDWHFVTEGARHLLGLGSGVPAHDGLHLYAGHPEYHLGPLAFLAGSATLPLPPAAGALVAQAVMAALGLIVLRQVERVGLRLAGDAARRVQTSVLVGGLLLAPSWYDAAVSSGHLDDVLVLTALGFLLPAVLDGRATAAGALVGLAGGAKSWGVILLPILLAMPARRRRALLVTAEVLGAVWGPFFLAAPAGTLRAMQVNIGVSPLSAVYSLGVHAGQVPGWLRPLQVLVALAAGVVAVRRGRWLAVPLAAIAARLMLDPGVLGYYDTGLVVAALTWDVAGRRRAVPVWTIATVLLLREAVTVTPDAQVHSLVRLALTAAGLVAATSDWSRLRRRIGPLLPTAPATGVQI
jgi:hypothetical protein